MCIIFIQLLPLHEGGALELVGLPGQFQGTQMKYWELTCFACFIGQVLLYEDDVQEFSLLFEDEGEQFRHVIDFKTLVVLP